jgi:hypothetical protein
MRKRLVKEEGIEGVGIDGMGSFFLAELRGRKPSPQPAERKGLRLGYWISREGVWEWNECPVRGCGAWWPYKPRGHGLW